MSSRPSVRRLTPLLGLLALLLALQVNPAGAGIGWCSRDPNFELGGRRGHVYVESQETMLQEANGPVEVEITVPSGVETRLISTDDGFGWNPAYKVTFREHPEWVIDNDSNDRDGDGYTNQFKIRIEVRAPTRGAVSLPVVVKFVANDGTVTVAEGVSNDWVVVKSYL